MDALIADGVDGGEVLGLGAGRLAGAGGGGGQAGQADQAGESRQADGGGECGECTPTAGIVDAVG